jgi:hypothetical protein
MATWEDVAGACLALPETDEATSGHDGGRQWRVRSKSFAWERPLRKKDLAELEDAAPAELPLAVYVPDEGAKAALIAAEPDIYFTTAHFDGYPIVLCRLERLDPSSPTELIGEAWACRAPKRLVAEHAPPS